MKRLSMNRNVGQASRLPPSATTTERNRSRWRARWAGGTPALRWARCGSWSQCMRQSERILCMIMLWAGLYLSTLVLRAHPTIPVITSARVESANFVFEHTGSTSPPCIPQAADSLAGDWTDLPGSVPGQSPVTVPIDRAKRFFRIRSDTNYSANAAGYATLDVPKGFSMIAHPFIRGSNTVAEVLPTPPEGIMLYKFDGARQTWSSVSQYEFGAWTQPNETLAPGEGVFLAVPVTNTRVTLGGIVNPTAAFAELSGQWNLVSLPKPEGSSLPTPREGDQIYRYDNSYLLPYTFDGGVWVGGVFGDPITPSFKLGESFWYFRNAPNPSATDRQALIYFNNRAPSFSVDAPFLDLGGCGLEGTNWLAQLVVSPTLTGNFSPAGDPLPFLTGIGAGYIDTRQGALRSIPSFQAGTAVWARIRAWDATKGATYDEAKANGSGYGDSAIIQVTVSGSGGSPPVLPSSLTGLQSFSQPPSLILSQPVNQTAFIGGTAEFHVTAQTGGSKPITYQWQKVGTTATNWADIPGANTDELVIRPVTADSVGSYRVIVDNTCRRQMSGPAALSVLQAPSFSALALNRADGSFSFILTADAGHNYTIEASTNLTDWISIRTLANFSGTLAVTDPEASNFDYRFYRVTLLKQ